MLNKLLQKGKRLMRSGTRLFASGDGTSCCCDSEPAYQYQECCDGQPRIWVALSAFGGRLQPCDIISIGLDDDGKPICFHLTGSEATTAELDEAGIVYIRQFIGSDGCATGSSCLGGIQSGTCRECPVACCIRGFPPTCKQGPLPCCVLGSAILVRWKQIRTETVEGFLHGIYGFTPDGLTITAGFSASPISEFIWETEVEMVIVNRANDGKKCVDVEPYCRRRDRYFQRLFNADGYRYTNNEDGFIRVNTQVLPINPRYEILLDRTVEDPNCDAPIYPDVAYDLSDPDTSLSDRKACGVSWVQFGCSSGGPCPGFNNPWYLRTSVNIDGSFNCNIGYQNYIRETIEKITPFGVANSNDNPHPSGENPRTTTIRYDTQYQVTTLSSDKCEARSCDDIDVGAGGDPLPLTSIPFISRSSIRSEGCSSCRQSIGL